MLSWYIVDERGILFHIRHQEQYLGYCGGIRIKQPGLPGAATSITQHSFRNLILSFISRPWLIWHPENLKRVRFIKKNLSIRLGARKRLYSPVSHNGNFEPAMGLVVIGVPTYLQSQGYGSVMLQEFERLAKENGLKK